MHNDYAGYRERYGQEKGGIFYEKDEETLSAATAVILATSLFAAGCGTQEAEQGGQTGTSAEAETTAASDLNSKTLDEIIEAAKEEGRVESVGMPDSWANWGLMWQGLADTYGLEHADADMSSAEELQMFATEGENGTKDIGDVGQAFGAQAVEEDLVQGYKTSYWDSVPDWAKGEDGKWMMAYTGSHHIPGKHGPDRGRSAHFMAGYPRGIL